MPRDKTHLFPFLGSHPCKEIDGIRFTKREIEIISCILSGRAQKTIASFLLIAPRTVETHTRNIMLKLECNSREGIINFIEKAGKSSLLRIYYQALLIRVDFEKRLESISNLIKKMNLVCRLVYEQEQENDFLLIHKIKEHLKLAGFIIKLDSREKLEPTTDIILNRSTEGNEYVIHITFKKFIEEFCKRSKNIKESKIFQLNKKVSAIFVFLSLEEEGFSDTFKNSENISIVRFHLSQNYFLDFFILLKKILRDPYLDQIITEFTQKLDSICSEFDKGSFFIKESINENSLHKKFYNEKLEVTAVHKRQYLSLVNIFIIVISSFTIIILIYGFFIFKEKQNSPIQGNQIARKSHAKELQTIRSDLVVPMKSVLLNRSKLLDQIDNKFKKQNGIKTVALVGPGGCGKTTLARQYADQQKANIVWEANAETIGSLRESFENLAHILAKNEEDKKILREIQEIKNETEKEERIIFFVKKHLKEILGWFFIFDNVEKFPDIQKYFPQDSATWGQGRVILTTRNSNIQHSKHINSIIQIGELSSDQKVSLFSKIMNNSAYAFTSPQTEETRKFLEDIPPFPLDVSTAAYYLQATGISYKKYLEYLNEGKKDFQTAQENFLKETGEDIKTRYSIISISLNNIINNNKDFIELLLLISLLDSQNIPRNLLSKYKSDIIVDNFIFNLKNYSLITEKLSKNSHIIDSISLHRSTQNISLVFLRKILNLGENKLHIQKIASALEDFLLHTINEQDLSKMKLLATHCEAFLSHYDLLPTTIIISIGFVLGRIQYYLGNYKKANSTFEKNFLNLETCKKDIKELKIAQALVYWGIIFKELLGDQEKAKNLIQEGLNLYNKEPNKDCFGRAWALTNLGNIYKHLGKYEKAKAALEESLTIYKNHPNENQIKAAGALTHLGSV